MALFDRRYAQDVARMVRDRHGCEMTPDEVESVRKSAFAKLRAALRDQGLPVPDDDEAFFLLMVAMLGPGGLPEADPDQVPEPDFEVDPGELDDLPELSEEDRRVIEAIDIEAIIRKETGIPEEGEGL